MDPLYKPLTKQQKNDLANRGLKEFEYVAPNKWIDPESPNYHLSSAFVFIASLYGRHFARKNRIPCGLFSLNICLLPIFYFASFKYLHVDQVFNAYKPRPTFNEALEFYPVARRAFKRALILREQEMEIIKARVGNVENQ